MRFLVLSLAVLLGSSSAQHSDAKFPNSGIRQLQHSDILSEDLENTRANEIRQTNSPLRTNIPFGAQLNRRSHSFIRTSSNDISQLKESVNSETSKAFTNSRLHIRPLTRKLQPPDEYTSEQTEVVPSSRGSPSQKILQTSGPTETSNMNSISQEQLGGSRLQHNITQPIEKKIEKFEKSENRSEKFKPHSFFDIYWSTKDKKRQFSNHTSTRRSNFQSSHQVDKGRTLTESEDPHNSESSVISLLVDNRSNEDETLKTKKIITGNAFTSGFHDQLQGELQSVSVEELNQVKVSTHAFPQTETTTRNTVLQRISSTARPAMIASVLNKNKNTLSRYSVSEEPKVNSSFIRHRVFQNVGNREVPVPVSDKSSVENQTKKTLTSHSAKASNEAHDIVKLASNFSIFVSNSDFQRHQKKRTEETSASKSTVNFSLLPPDDAERHKFDPKEYPQFHPTQQPLKTEVTVKLTQSYIPPNDRKEQVLNESHLRPAEELELKKELLYSAEEEEPEKALYKNHFSSGEQKLPLKQRYLTPKKEPENIMNQRNAPPGRVNGLEVRENYLPPSEKQKQEFNQNLLPPEKVPDLNIEQRYFSPTRQPEIHQSYLPPEKIPILKLEQTYFPPNLESEGKRDHQYLPSEKVPHQKLKQNYLPPNVESERKVEQRYLPPENVPSVKLKQSYLPPNIESERNVEQKYIPSDEVPDLKLEQSYLPPNEESERQVDQRYLPPGGVPNLKLEQSYLPPHGEPKQNVEQKYHPPRGIPHLKLEQSYFPPNVESERKIDQIYLPPENLPSLKLEQNYLPPNVESDRKVEQRYLPPDGVPNLKLKQSYLPPNVESEREVERKYIPPNKVPNLKLEQSYLPPNVESGRHVGQRYLPSDGVPNLKLEQSYIPPYLSLNREPEWNVIQTYEPRKNVSDVQKNYRTTKLEFGEPLAEKHSNPNRISRIAANSLPPDKQTVENISFETKLTGTSSRNTNVEHRFNNILALSNSKEYSSYSDYSRSNFSIPNRPFKVTAVTLHRNDKEFVPLRYVSPSRYSFPSRGIVIRNPFTSVESSEPVRQQRVKSSFLGCDSNDDCNDHELCSSGTCVDACTKAKGRCVGHAMCSSRRHVAACTCPRGFSAVSRFEGSELKFDCMQISVLKAERRVVHKSSRVPFYTEQKPPRYSNTGRIASGPIRGSSSSGIVRNTVSTGSGDPCRPTPCGPNTRCDVNARSIAQCKCLDNFVPDGNTINGCKPQCVSDFECPDDYRCRQTKCERVCVPGACGLNAECDARNHRAVCTCPDGYSGSADVGCNKNLPVVRANPPAPPPDPCFPSPCGDGAECRERDGRAVCTCPYAYEGDPLTRCSRVECVESSECPSNQACQQQRCINPCTIPEICGRGAECTVRDHQPVCSCGRGFTGDPFVSCRRFDPQELCQPSPCGQNTNCRVQNDRAVCSCIDNYIGNPLEGCRAECVSDRDCPGDRTCRENRCVNPCAYGACGENAYCDVRNNQVSCTCPQFFQGDPYSRCFAECTEHDACLSSQACFELRCIDPCEGACGTGADCKVDDHKPICSCPKGFTGHPFESCRPFTEADLCNPNPCGTGADCTPGHDRSGESRPVCTCPVGYIGNPLVSCQRGECQTPNDCPADQTCHAYHCQSACYTETGSPCGELAECSVRNRQPVCSCPPGYSGDPLRACYTAATSRFASTSRFHSGRT